MDLHKKEDILHKVVATSAFLFALSLLPVAQFVVERSKVAKAPVSSQGQVAGARTDTETVRGSVPVQDTALCEGQKTEELAELENWAAKTRKGYTNAMSAKIKPYQEAIPVLQGSPAQIAEEKAALEGLMAQEKAPYDKKLSDLEKAVASQKDAIASRPCSTP